MTELSYSCQQWLGRMFIATVKVESSTGGRKRQDNDNDSSDEIKYKYVDIENYKQKQSER